MSKLKTHLITADMSLAQKRELHVESLANEVRQPIERLLPALGFRSPQMRGGMWRVVDVTTCPACGATAPVGRADLVPWTFGSKRILCDNGCELGVRELLDLLCKTDEELDAVLGKIQAGRPSLRRFYVLELRLNEPAEGEEAKWRRAIGDDVTETLRRLEPNGEDTVRAIAVDAADLMAVQTLIRSESDLPWCDRLPIDHRGRLMRMSWHNAPLSFAERELQRRLAV